MLLFYFIFCSPSFAPTSVAMAFNRSALSRTRIYIRVAFRATFRYIHEKRQSHRKRWFAPPLHQRNNLQTMWTADYANYRKVFFLQNLTLSDGSLLHETRVSVLQTHFFPTLFHPPCNEGKNKVTWVTQTIYRVKHTTRNNTPKSSVFCSVLILLNMHIYNFLLIIV